MGVFNGAGAGFRGIRAAGVENAFAPGSVCDRAYTELSTACDRLRHRLNAGDEDPDVETVLHAELDIRKDLCLRMFRLGQRLHL